jgi:hypothetical protein
VSTEEKIWDLTMDINLKGVVCHASLPQILHTACTLC